jgi:hypothetical protein
VEPLREELEEAPAGLVARIGSAGAATTPDFVSVGMSSPALPNVSVPSSAKIPTPHKIFWPTLPPLR